MGAGIKEVALRAGVSTATVSHVINHTRYVSDETTMKVEKVMKELSYSPNYLAKMLKEKKSNVVGMVVPDVSNFFFTEIAEAVEKKLKSEGYTMILCNTDENLEAEKEQITQLQSYMVSGIIIAPTTMDYNYRRLVSSYDYPMVFIDRRLNTPQGDSVLVDGVNVTESAIDYLIGKGHTRIGFIGGHSGISTTNDRYTGYLNALKKHGIAINPAYSVFGDAQMASAYALCEKLMNLNEVTAMLVSSSLMSIGAMQYLVKNKYDIPGEIAIIGYDDYNWTSITSPPLTTIKQPTARMGELAAELLLKRINNKERAFEDIVLDAQLIIRQSC